MGSGPTPTSVHLDAYDRAANTVANPDGSGDPVQEIRRPVSASPFKVNQKTVDDAALRDEIDNMDPNGTVSIDDFTLEYVVEAGADSDFRRIGQPVIGRAGRDLPTRTLKVLFATGISAAWEVGVRSNGLLTPDRSGNLRARAVFYSRTRTAAELVLDGI